MRSTVRSAIAILTLAMLTAAPIRAYDYPLSSRDIRDAYFLGSGDPVKRLEYFEKYKRRYPVAKNGEYVASIFFETPFVQIAERVSQSFSNYFAPDAIKDYLGKPEVCRVRAEIYFGIPSSPAIRRWKEFTIQLKQHDKEIPLKTKWVDEMFSGDEATQAGMYLNAEFDAEQIDTDAPVTIVVVDPAGSNLVERIRLAPLR